jgi:hypothetical protein
MLLVSVASAIVEYFKHTDQHERLNAVIDDHKVFIRRSSSGCCST